MASFSLLRKNAGWRASTGWFFPKFCPFRTSGSEAESKSRSSTLGNSAISSGGPFVSRIKSRGVIRLDGPDILNFLQGIVSNDMNKFKGLGCSIPIPGKSVPTPNQPAVTYPPLYAALLNPQGRFLHDLFFYRLPQDFEKLNKYGKEPNGESTDSVSLYADVDSSSIDEVLSTFLKHRLRAKVNFEDVSKQIAVWARFGGALAQNGDSGVECEAGGIGYGGSEELPAKSSAEIFDGGWRWHKDPRLGALGLRGIFPEDSTPPLVEAKEEVDEVYFKLWRYELGVAEGPNEIPKSESIPLEYNLDALNAISFDKGCYIGQELTARTHFRGVIRKRVVPIQFVSETGEEVERGGAPGSEVSAEPSGKVIGKIVAALGGRGLAHLRMESTFDEKARFKINGMQDQVYVIPRRPDWWPQDWASDASVPNIQNNAAT